MPDNRPRVAVERRVDLDALDAELGSHGLCAGPGEIVVAEGSPVTQQQLEDAVAAAPEYVEPASGPSVEERLAALEARADRAAAAEVTGDAAKIRDALKPA